MSPASGSIGTDRFIEYVVGKTTIGDLKRSFEKEYKTQISLYPADTGDEFEDDDDKLPSDLPALYYKVLLLLI